MGAKERKLPSAAVAMMMIVGMLAYLVVPAVTVKAGETENTDTLSAGAALVVGGDALSAGVALILDTEIAVNTETENAEQAQPSADHAEEDTAASEGQADSTQEDTGAEDEISYAMTNVQNTLNVRASASEEAQIIGRLYADCYGEILERGDGWTLLRSGNVVGWAKNDYLLFDEEAEEALSQVGRWTATANESGLRIRKAASTDAGIYALLAQGDIVDIYEDQGEWLKVDYDGYEGYVSAEYVTVDLICGTGETLAEIAAREAEEAEARRRAQERRAALSEEQANVEANYTDVQLLAALIWCEAGNQPYEGQLAVGAVVMNRVNHPAYPNTISGVIYAPGQFTPAMTGRVARALQRGVPDSCTQAATEAMSGVSNVGGVLHFNVKTIRSSDLIIGDHAFW